MNTKFYFLMIVSSLIISCTNHKYPDSRIKTVKASVDMVVPLDMCVYPIQIEQLSDNLVILDIGNKTQCLSTYSLDGDFMYSFGSIGKAENEVSEVTHFFKIDNNRISLNKPGGILYYIFDDLTDSICKHEYRRLNGLPISIHDIYADSSGILILSNSDDERFSYIGINTDEVFKHTSYPSDFVNEADFQQAVFNYAPKFCVDMKNKRFCVGTYIGGILESFSITPNGIKPIGVNLLFTSKYTKFDNGGVSWNKDSRIGFDDITADEDHIYTLLSNARGECLIEGNQDSFADKITVFNWDASLHSEISVGHNMISICISEKRKEFYAICYKQPDGFYLIHATY